MARKSSLSTLVERKDYFARFSAFIYLGRYCPLNLLTGVISALYLTTRSTWPHTGGLHPTLSNAENLLADCADLASIVHHLD